MTRRSHLERAELRRAAQARLAAGEPLRQVAAALGVPRSTLRGWRAAPLQEGVPAAVAAALTTPAGLQWLCRLVVILHLVITRRAAGGVRLVCECLQLSGLAGIVGASYGSQQAVNAAVQEALVAGAKAPRAALAVGMPQRELAACVDATFHPAICLVAIDPRSNFIVAEGDAADRPAAPWRQFLEPALAGLPVTLIQASRDEAGALRHPIEQDLGVARASELLHEVAKGTGLHLARAVKQANATAAIASATGSSRP